MSLIIRPCRLDECSTVPRSVARDEPQAVAFWDAAPGRQREPRWHRYAKDI